MAQPALRLVNKADFERLLAAGSLTRSTHFVLHHVAAVASAVSPSDEKTGGQELSTELGLTPTQSVDITPDRQWLGALVPKRHARRAVTRSLLKRQIRAAFERHRQHLPAGLWLVRLRSAFAPERFVSASSAALALAARTELDALLARVRP
ncbi:MAG: ribonuclease P protein component [Burkholderiales bacterium]|nr:ribonuclease P protein component [Burkholderiales bacterium]